MSEEEIINKSNDYIRLFENGYCKNCNELCLIDNFPNEDLKNLLYAWQVIYKQEKEKNEKLEQDNLILAMENENSISKDKIKEKIKELEKEIEEKQENGLDFTLIHEHEIDTNGIIIVLKELLEEE